MAQANLERLQVQIIVTEEITINSKGLVALGDLVDSIKTRILLVHFMNNKHAKNKEQRKCANKEEVMKIHFINSPHKMGLKSQVTRIIEIKTAESTMSSKEIPGNFMKTCFASNKKRLDNRSSKIRLRLISTVAKVVIINMMISLNKDLQNKSRKNNNNSKVNKRKIGKINTTKVLLNNGRISKISSSTIIQ